MNQHFFGPSEKRLFGVYHPSRKRSQGPIRAALICPPIGQEFVRTHWCLRLLAGQLTRKGVGVLRMDYRGIGDSFGSSEDVLSLDSWIDDVNSGVNQLRERSGAHSVMLIGLRFGAFLAAKASNVSDNVSSLVAWEPVVKGSDYLFELRKMHHQMMDLWHCKLESIDNENQMEILGSLYAQDLLSEMEDANIDFGDIAKPQLIVDLESREIKYGHQEPSLQKVIRVQDENSWNNLDTLETAWLRPQTTRELANTVDDMFCRLERFQIMAPSISTPVSSMEAIS